MRVGRANGESWLRLGEAAAELGVSLNTLRRWSDSGKLTCYRSPGGHRRYRRGDVEALLRAEDPTSAAAPSLAARIRRWLRPSPTSWAHPSWSWPAWRPRASGSPSAGSRCRTPATRSRSYTARSRNGGDVRPEDQSSSGEPLPTVREVLRTGPEARHRRSGLDQPARAFRSREPPAARGRRHPRRAARRRRPQHRGAGARRVSRAARLHRRQRHLRRVHGTPGGATALGRRRGGGARPAGHGPAGRRRPRAARRPLPGRRTCCSLWPDGSATSSARWPATSCGTTARTRHSSPWPRRRPATRRRCAASSTPSPTSARPPRRSRAGDPVLIRDLSAVEAAGTHLVRRERSGAVSVYAAPIHLGHDVVGLLEV